MTTPASTLIAQAAKAPLQLDAGKVTTLLWVLLGTAILMAAIRLAGEWLARTHPEPTLPAPKPVIVQEAAPVAPRQPPHIVMTASAHADAVIDAEEMAAIAAAVATILGHEDFVITEIHHVLSPEQTPSANAIMQQWSWEGRRQIYNSHSMRPHS